MQLDRTPEAGGKKDSPKESDPFAQFDEALGGMKDAAREIGEKTSEFPDVERLLETGHKVAARIMVDGSLDIATRQREAIACLRDYGGIALDILSARQSVERAGIYAHPEGELRSRADEEMRAANEALESARRAAARIEDLYSKYSAE
jgi:hypothetical protein